AAVRGWRCSSSALRSELAKLVGDDALVAADAHLLTDMTRMPGRADAVVMPSCAEAVAKVVAWCLVRAVPLPPRGTCTDLERCHRRRGLRARVRAAAGRARHRRRSDPQGRRRL